MMQTTRQICCHGAKKNEAKIVTAIQQTTCKLCHKRGQQSKQKRRSKSFDNLEKSQGSEAHIKHKKLLNPWTYNTTTYT
ncbi:hypothetical protein DUNSADRAFT_3197 [Dunaliella salina]|uniref:Encoded protein n=1 Tax=Dunaliella salina TaxID=3046 RepID=A0ABQ7FVL3_DUNSA|nr:hypothetical protein DUNSADRAFT_3197 [Dunaliella salina]|eukprot:KAF5826423.1 hypothetical protein DUNSADRAFT_3197 [Dunaliella salina]